MCLYVLETCVFRPEFAVSNEHVGREESLKRVVWFGLENLSELAEIAAALTVAGELSLGAASRIDHDTRTNEWVDAHEKLGRNR